MCQEMEGRMNTTSKDVPFPVHQCKPLNTGHVLKEDAER